MVIEQLVFNEDGSYEIKMVEVADNWYDDPERSEDDVWAELDKAYTEGVNSAYDQ